MKAENKDIVYLHFTGYSDDGRIFDSTEGEIGQKLYGRNNGIMFIVGVDKIVKGLENEIRNMEEGEEREVWLEPEQSFGERKKDLLKIIPLNIVKEKGLNPKAGMSMQIEIDGIKYTGVVRSINGGRMLVDFNHPLAGKKVRYKIKLEKVIKDPFEKAELLMKDAGVEGNATKEGGKIIVKVKTEKDYEKMKKALEKVVGEGFDVQVVQ
ncbi:MAG: peptidylprolyl isomerase [Candidatus Anstonellales archaeon]